MQTEDQQLPRYLYASEERKERLRWNELGIIIRLMGIPGRLR